ncbi:hypothetical protein B0O99DRAFT_684608 [Bisporella sp. PMI_857]|nr:hypothetical protein B0O99DRAFT_684608 [Bisporella sp. PMI_857]
MENEPMEPLGARYYQNAGYNLAISIIFPMLNTLVVSARFYARKRQKMSLQADDWLTIPALILLMGSCASMIAGVAKHASGYPTPSMTEQRSLTSRSELNIVNSATVIVTKIELAVDLMTIPGLACAKLSFLFFYHRIFCTHGTGFPRLFIITMICAVAVWGAAFELAYLFMCGTHFSAWWGTAENTMKYCQNSLRTEYGFTLSDFLTDAIILLIPLPLLWNLQLRTAKKIAVSLVFLLGSVAIGASIGRFVIIWEIVNMGFDRRADQNCKSFKAP